MLLLPTARPLTTLFATLLLAMAATVSSAEEQKPEIDPTADKRMRAMSDYLGNLKAFSVDVTHTMEIEQEGAEKQSRSDQRHVVIEQPNRLAMTAAADGEGTVICDGKQLFAYWPSGARYLLSEAPATFNEILRHEASLLMGTGRTAVQYATGDWYKQAIKSATKVALLEPEQVDGVECDRIEISQQNAKIFLWIEQGEHPLLRKMSWELQFDKPDADFKMPSQVVAYSNWELEPTITDDTFAIEIPEGAEKVDSLRTQEPTDEGPHPLLAAELPDCELTLLEGGAQKLADLKDKKVVVLDFWALWCVPCLEALPIVDQVATKFADRDVAFFAVNLGDEPDAIREFLEKQELKLTIAVDPESKLSELFHADSIPLTVIADKQGKVQVVHVGYGEGLGKSLTEEIEAVLEGKQLAEETLQAAREAQRPGDPIPTGEDAVTSKDAIEYAIAFNLRTSVEPYKEVGSRDDQWDDDAIEFLTQTSRHFASAKDCKTQLELVEMAEPLAEQGCDDPLVKYCHGAMLQDGMQDAASQARGLRFVEQSYYGLVERGYPANRAFAAAHRMYRSLCDGGEKEKVEEFLTLTEKHALEAILQDDLETNDGRTLYDHLNGFAMKLPLERRAAFCEAAKAHEEKSPYVVNMLVGEYHLDAAWKARGTGFASKVTEEGWKGFAEHMDLARAAFEKAWKAAPKRPEAATAMVKISMGSSRSPAREMRMWFDRAVKAQLDYRTAYTHLFYGLMPRWHGSHEQMYQFGLECKETGRYDTDVPFELCDVIWQIMKDDHNPLGKQYAQRPGLYEHVRTVCQGYIEQEDRNMAWWKAVWLGFAYLNAQWDDAAKMLEELDSQLDTDALGRFPLAADEVIAAVRLHSSPHADAIVAAFETADNGKHDEAVTAIKALLTEDDLHPSIASQLASRLQGLEWSERFRKGGPVTLMSAGNLHGWKTVAGNWTQNADGGFQGVSNQGGVILECQADFGTHWEMRGEVTHGPSPYNPWDTGILFNVDGRPLYSIMFNPTERWVAAGLHRDIDDFHQPFTPNGKTTKFVVRVAGDTVNVWLNDNLLIEDQQVEGLADLTPARLAIGAKYGWNGSMLTYQNLEIERIEPEEEP